MTVLVNPARPSSRPAPQVDVVFIRETAERDTQANPVRKILGIVVPPPGPAFSQW